MSVLEGRRAAETRAADSGPLDSSGVHLQQYVLTRRQVVVVRGRLYCALLARKQPTSYTVSVEEKHVGCINWCALYILSSVCEVYYMQKELHTLYSLLSATANTFHYRQYQKN